jgi:ribosomal protein L22
MAGEDIRAQARSISISAQKVRLVTDLINGKGVVEALDILRDRKSVV